MPSFRWDWSGIDLGRKIEHIAPHQFGGLRYFRGYVGPPLNWTLGGRGGSHTIEPLPQPNDGCCVLTTGLLCEENYWQFSIFNKSNHESVFCICMLLSLCNLANNVHLKDMWNCILRWRKFAQLELGCLFSWLLSMRKSTQTSVSNGYQAK